MMMQIPYRLFAAALLSFSTGCNLLTDYQRPVVETPAQWHEPAQSASATVDPQWWQAFASNQLNRLMREALTYNNDLAAARQRVEQARAQAKIAGAGLWPAASLSGDFSDSRNNKTDSQQSSGQIDIAYEVDLWGANRARRDAGTALMLSQIFARDALQLVVMADVGQAYFNLLAIQERRQIASDFLDTVNAILTIIEARQRSGAAYELEVAQQRTAQANARASLDLLMQQQTLAENSLAILLGHPPQHLALEPVLFAELAVPGIAAEQPATLLQRRPDIGQVEMQLIAANADIAVARAAFYPKLQLSLGSVLANPQPAGVAATLAAGLTQPLFQGGRLAGALSNALAANAELAEIYRKTVLTAFKEVEDAAAIYNNSSRRLTALETAAAQARLAYTISQERYRLGAIDYQALLNTQTSYLSTENSRVQARLDVLVAQVQLYKALGGGWSLSEQNTDLSDLAPGP
ncbi:MULTISPECIES: efflux transporter outer membrane subunit [Methylomonas]|uniref:RND transporter n=2 Tax=Methylomonas TaxID=416 RepID=A0A126T1S2_9GAMM|nr:MULTISPECIES: efflux transporter outer membrane subunit [Methylomonas]AMK76036.1 RND transporter [Methylomonas denitrificans]OAH99831.1 RND transporter [Methylomonas methanica]TCV83945.1 NodT family efflux transporter outer membrane factor (OMF) lipoprotein [Methylomonas methanica]